jgi:plasmid rolling circle replication initiator protein Rep
MNGYINQLGNLIDLEFVTLTRKNCTKEELKDVVFDMLKKASLIQRHIREKLKIEINGIRKLEITYNANTKTYHPHLHYLIDNRIGNILVEEWLKRNIGVTQKQGWDKQKKSFVDIQDVRLADQNSLNEIFKYSTKIMSHKKREITFYLDAINTIMEAMYKKRSIQTFGKIKKVNEDIDGKELNSQEYEELEDTCGGIVEWIWQKNDWINSEDGNKLTGYVPPEIELQFIDEPDIPDIEKFIFDYPVRKTYLEKQYEISN